MENKKQYFPRSQFEQEAIKAATLLLVEVKTLKALKAIETLKAITKHKVVLKPVNK